MVWGFTPLLQSAQALAGLAEATVDFACSYSILESASVDLVGDYEIESNGATDDFERADGGLGSNWTQLYAAEAAIASGIAKGDSGNVSVGAYYTGRSWTNDQVSKGILAGGISGGSEFASVIVRHTGTGATANGYKASVNNSTWYITRDDSGVGTDIASGSRTFNIGDEIECRAAGTTISFWHNGTFIHAVDDATYSSGDPGFEIYRPWVGFASWTGEDTLAVVDLDLLVEYHLGDDIDFIDDYFNRPSDSSLGPDYTPFMGAGLAIFAGGGSAVGANSAERGSLRTAEEFENDQFVEFTINNMVFGLAGAALRMTGADGGRNGYLVNIGYAGNWYIGRYIDGSGVNIAEGTTTAPSPGDRFRGEIVGTTLKLFINGVEIGSITDSEFSAGYPGLYTYSDARIDDARFGAVVASAGTVDLACSYPIYAAGTTDLACSYAIGEETITFTAVQSKASASADPAAVTLDSTPVEGNLLVAVMMERSGTTSANSTISGTGWEKRIARDVSLGDTTYRRSLSVWTKTAGASEPTSISVDDGTANVKRLLVLEVSAGGAEVTWTFEDAASNDNGNTTNATSIATGTTGSIAAGNLLQLGILAVKVATGGTEYTITWASDTLTTVAEADTTTSHERAMFIGMAQQSDAGTRASTASVSTSAGNVGLLAGILVFSAEEVGGTESGSVDLSCSFVIYSAGTADLAASYPVLSTANVDLSCAYPVLSAASTDLGCSYPILSGSQVDLACSYPIYSGGVVDLSCSYAIYAASTADLGCSYAIYEDAEVDLPCSYAIFSSGTADFTGNYAIYSRDSADLSCSYAIQGIEVVELACSYEIRSAGEIDFTGSYPILSAATVDLEASYAVLSATSTDLSCVYAILSGAVEDLGCSYAIYSAGVTDLGCVYAICESDTADLECSYAVLSGGVTDLDGAYPIYSGTVIDLDCSYEIAFPVGSGAVDLVCGYSILEADEIDFTVSYGICEDAEVDFTVSYPILASATADLSCGYPVLSPATSDLSCSYAIYSANAVDLGCSYAILAGANTDLACSYPVYSGALVDLLCSYSIYAAGTVDLTCGYEIQIELGSATVDLPCSYAIYSAGTADLSATYAVLSDSAVDLNCGYAVYAPNTIDLPCAYPIYSSGFSELECSYAVLLASYADLSAAYAILVGGNADLPCSYQIISHADVDLSCSYAILAAGFSDLLASYTILTDTSTYEVFYAKSPITRALRLSSPVTMEMSSISPITVEKNMRSTIDLERIES